MGRKLDSNQLEARMKRALRVGGDTHTLGDILAAVDAGDMQTWVNGDSVVISEIIRYPQYSTCDIVLVAGRTDEIMALHELVEEFAAENGCIKLRTQGREGWERVLPKYGWEVTPKVFYEKQLQPIAQEA
jgi:hypothetical protein